MLKNPRSLFKMTMEVVYPAVDKIRAESTVIQVVAKRLIQKVSLKKNDLLDMLLPSIQRFAPIPNTEFVLGCCSVLLLHLEVPEVVIIGVLGVINQNMIGVKVGWSQGDIVMIGVIETVQNRHLVMEETTEIMIVEEADMKVQGELKFNWTLKVKSLGGNSSK